MVFSLRASVDAFERRYPLGSTLISNAKWISIMRAPCLIGKTRAMDPFAPSPVEKVYAFDDKAPLGAGAFGNVVLGTHRITQQQVAIKRIHSTDDRKDVRYEIRSLRAMQDHPNVVPFVEYFDDGKTLSLVMQVAQHGSLYSYVQRHGLLTEAHVQHITRQLLSAMQACHAKHIVHRDLKPENILITAIDGHKFTVQVADFGLAGDATHPLQRTCGTEIFMAPEMRSKRMYGTAVDMWSLGATIYSIMTGVVPEADKIDQLSFHGMTEAARDFILAMLQADPKLRATASDLLKHDWLLEYPALTCFVQRTKAFVEKNHDLMALLCGGDCIDSASATLHRIAQSLSSPVVDATKLVQLTSDFYTTILDLELDFPMLRDQIAGMP